MHARPPLRATPFTQGASGVNNGCWLFARVSQRPVVSGFGVVAFETSLSSDEIRQDFILC